MSNNIVPDIRLSVSTEPQCPRRRDTGIVMIEVPGKNNGSTGIVSSVCDCKDGYRAHQFIQWLHTEDKE